MDVSAVVGSCTLTEARFLLDHFMSMAINKVPALIIMFIRNNHMGTITISPLSVLMAALQQTYKDS